MAGLAVFAAPPTQADTLYEALGELWITHPQIRAAQKDAEGARSDVERNLAAYWPVVTVTGDYGYQNLTNPSRADKGPYSRMPSKSSLTVTQNLFNGFATSSSVRAARFNIAVAEGQLVGTRQSTLFDGIEAYVDILRQIRLVELAKANENTIQLQLNLEDERVQRGSGVAVDVIQAKSRLQTAKERRIEFEGNLQDAYTRYYQVFGRRADLARMSDPPMPAGLIPTRLEDAIAVALKENPAIYNSLATVEANRENRRNAYSGYAPQVDLVADASYERNADNTVGVTRDFTVTLSTSWDLFNGFETRSQVERATFDYRASQDNHDFVRSRVEEQVRLAWQALLTARARLEVQENAVNIASELYTSRSALRDAGKALGLSDDQVDRLSKRVHWFDRGPVDDAQLRDAGLDPTD
ncbi:MAG: TolC family protein, partial [Rhodospirillales bacterium]